jgi:hypothetical protein
MTTIASARVGADGSYRIVRRFDRKAAYTVAVNMRSGARNLAHHSVPRLIRIGTFPAARVVLPARTSDGYVGSTPLSGPTDFSSTLTTPQGDPLSGVAATLRVTSYDGTVTEGHGVTDGFGEVTVRVPVLVRSRIQWFFGGSGEYGPSTSEPFVWRVRPRVYLTLNDNTLRVGQRLVVRGRTHPLRPGHVVRLWAGSAPRTAPSTVPSVKPVLLARAVVGADGRYRLVRAFAKRGPRILFVTVSAGNGTLQGWSAERVVRVRAR